MRYGRPTFVSRDIRKKDTRLMPLEAKHINTYLVETGGERYCAGSWCKGSQGIVVSLLAALVGVLIIASRAIL